jgi:hypothetical protein
MLLILKTAASILNAYSPTVSQVGLKCVWGRGCDSAVKTNAFLASMNQLEQLSGCKGLRQGHLVLAVMCNVEACVLYFSFQPVDGAVTSSCDECCARYFPFLPLDGKAMRSCKPAVYFLDGSGVVMIHCCTLYSLHGTTDTCLQLSEKGRGKTNGSWYCHHQGFDVIVVG